MQIFMHCRNNRLALKTTYSNLIHTYEDEGKPTPEIDLSDFGKIFSDGDVSF